MSRTWVEVRLLGGCRLLIGSRESDLRYDKVRALLAWLVMLPGVPQRREKLATLLWPDADAEAARRSLRHALHVLRAALGDASALLYADRNTVRLAADGLTCDVLVLASMQVRFSNGVRSSDDIVTLEDAAALYRGEFLAGIETDFDSELQEWLRHQREAAVNRVCNVWRQLASVRLAGGMIREALGASARLLELSPFDEQANRICIETLAAIHGADAGLAHYAAYQRRLKDECGVEPGADIQAVAADLRSRIAAPAAWTEKRPLAALCVQMLVNEADDEENRDHTHSFEILINLIQERLGNRVAHVHVLYEGLAIVCFGVPVALDDSALAAARLAVALAAQPDVGPCIAQAIHCALPVVTVGVEGYAPPGSVITAVSRACALAQAGEIIASNEAAQWLQRDLGRHGGEVFQLTPHAQHAGHFTISAISNRACPLSVDFDLPLAGRRTELAQLLHRLRAARNEPTSLAIVGEAGLGKTRLAFEAGRRAKRGVAMIWLRCSRETQGEPLAPLRGWMSALVHVGPRESGARAERRLARLDRLWQARGLVTELFHPQQEVIEAGMVTMSASPNGRFARLIVLAERFAASRTLFVVVDDIQWADQATRALLDRWLLTARGRVFTLVIAREAGNAPQDVEMLRPARLDDADARTLLQQPRPSTRTAHKEIEAAVRLADGLPLFLVELKRYWHLYQQSAIDLPRNMHDLLGARFDALPPQLRQLASVAAVLGEEGEFAVLSHFIGQPLSSLLSQFVRFVEVGLMYAPAQGSYRFRHQALHRAALERLPAAERKSWHARAAAHLVGYLPCARIALHWERAERPDDAIVAYCTAGKQASAVGAHRDAMIHFRNALKLGAQHRADSITMLSAYMGQGLAFVELEGYGSLTAYECFERAKEVAQSCGDLEMRLRAEWGMWQSSSSRVGHFGSLRHHSQPLLALAMAHGDPVWLASGHLAMGNNLCFLGRFADAERHLNAAAELGTQPGVSARILEHVGQALDVHALSFLIWVARKRGDDAAVQRTRTRALARAEALDNHPALAFVLAFSAVESRMADRPGEAARWTARLRKISEPRGYDLWTAVAVMIDNWAQVRLGKSADVSALEVSVEAVNVAMPSVAAEFLIAHMDALRHLGQHAEALAVFDRTISVARRYRDRHALDTLWNLRARCLDELGGRDIEARRAKQRAQRIRDCFARMPPDSRADAIVAGSEVESAV